MKNKFCYVSIIIINIFFFSISYANTTRDIGTEPELNLNLTSKWIIFYTNIERLRNGIPVLQYDTVLEEAAKWQAEYCSKINGLNHITQIKNMQTVKDRIEYFNGFSGICGENLNVKFSINSEGIPYSVKKDETGIYYDFEDYTIHWRNERQMAYIMLDSWMKSPGHRKNILNKDFLWIGSGTKNGIYNDNKSYYGCQVFAGYGSLAHDLIKAKYDIPEITIKNIKNNIFSFSYNGEMEPGIIEVSGDNEIISHQVERKNGLIFFTKNKIIRGLLVMALYDKQNKILYPLQLIK
jgi:uncharacterized protein YkwD